VAHPKPEVRRTSETWLEGPAQHRQTAGRVDEKAEAERLATVKAFDHAVRHAIGPGVPEW